MCITPSHNNADCGAGHHAKPISPENDVSSSVLDAVGEEEISEAGFGQILGNTLGTEPTGRWGPDGGLDRWGPDGGLGDTQPRDLTGDSTSLTEEYPASSGQFRVLRPHARGGLGEVYVAYDQELHRKVALKEIRPEHADYPQNRARFQMEAEITGNLEHPGIVPVYQLGRHADGRPYYCMRFIQGISLRKEIERFYSESPGRDPGARALELRRLLGRFVAVCDTIAYAHSRAVLHRDIKPDNIVLGPYGETLVVDWGLAKPIGSPPEAGVPDDAVLRPPSARASGDTLHGVVVGTPTYMSPEQARGHVDEIGPASDIYSLGTTLYTLLTGKGPFDHGPDIRTLLQKVMEGRFATPRTIRPGIPRAMEAICLKAMARRPEDRYASARELAEDLERWLADEPVLAYREPPFTRLLRWGRRHRSMMTGAVIATMVTLAGSLVLQARIGRQDQTALLLKTANQDLKTTNRDLWIKLARSEDDRGSLNRQLGRHTDALDNYREASVIWRMLALQYPDVREYQVRLAATVEHLKALMDRGATEKVVKLPAEPP
jgi:serine/threonine protein kinase